MRVRNVILRLMCPIVAFLSAVAPSSATPATELPLPAGSSVAVTSGSLVVRVPEIVKPQAAPPTALQIHLGDEGWAASLVASERWADDPSISGYEVRDATNAIPAEAYNFWQARLDPHRSSTALTESSLTAARASQAVAQIARNLSVIEAGDVGVASTGITSIDVGAGHQAARVMIDVSDWKQATSHLGDLLDGPSIGITPDAEPGLVGLAVILRDASGPRIATWINWRLSLGSGVFDPVLASANDPLTTTLTFSNANGVAQQTASLSGGAAGLDQAQVRSAIAHFVDLVVRRVVNAAW